MHRFLPAAIWLALSLGPALAQSDLAITENTPAIEIDVSIDERARDLPALVARLKADADATVEEYRGYADEDFAERGKDRYWNPHYLQARYTVTFMNDTTASVLTAISTYSGGAHGNEGFASTLFDVASDSVVGPERLFGSFDKDSDAFLALQAYAREGLIFERAHRLDLSDLPPEDIDWVNEGTDEPDELSTFTLIEGPDPAKASGVMLYFPPYQVASYAEGSYTLEVPALVFIGYLAPEFAELFDPNS